MNQDLNNLLQDWPHESGQLKVRKIIGNDGKAKLQLRLDLGLIQMEMNGRPDGTRPHNSDSLLSYFQKRAKRKIGAGEPFTLTPEQCNELQQEGLQYYHRYISLFQVEDYPAVIRDTQRNLDMFDFIKKYAPREEIAQSMEQFRPYVMMMKVRATATIELEREDYMAAIDKVQKGMEEIRAAYIEAGHPQSGEGTPEITFLEEWLEEIHQQRPIPALERMQRELEQAIAAEAYERAAELRDLIRAQQEQPQQEQARQEQV